MSNPDSNQCSALRVATGCQPDPVKQVGAVHKAEIVNCGNDRYTVSIQVRILSGSQPGASLALHDGTRQVDVLRWFGGTFGPSRSGTWNQIVQHRSGGTAKGHSFRTIAEFASDAEADPQDDDPKLTYSCPCTVDVTVI